MSKLSDISKGWFYSKKLNHFQKVNNCIYCYVSPILFGFEAKLYMRGTTSMCELDVRTESNLEEIFRIANKWINDYKDGDLKKIHQDKYSISNPNGVWRNNFGLKEYWIK